jgi:hypothetical protein
MMKVYTVYKGSSFDSPIQYTTHSSEEGAKRAIKKFVDEESTRNVTFLTREKLKELLNEQFYWEEIEVLD